MRRYVVSRELLIFFLYMLSLVSAGIDRLRVFIEIYSRFPPRSYVRRFLDLVDRYMSIGLKQSDSIDRGSDRFKGTPLYEVGKRLAQVVDVGGDLDTFAVGELEQGVSVFRDNFERLANMVNNLFTMVITTGTVVSTLFVVMIFLLSILGFGDEAFVLSMAVVIVLSNATLMVSVALYIPRDPIISRESKAYRTAVSVAGLSIAIAPVVFIAFYSTNMEWSVVLSISSLPLIVGGLYIYAIESRINKLDEEMITLLRSLIHVFNATRNMQVTVKSIPSQMLRSLRKHYESFRNLIASNVSFDTALGRLTESVSSHLFSYISHTLRDIVVLGADAIRVGRSITSVIVSLLEIRRRRIQLFRSHFTTAIIVSSLMPFVFALLRSVMDVFASLITGVQTFLPFGYVDPIVLEYVAMIYMATIPTALGIAVRSISPGTLYGSTLTSGILIMCSGISYFIGRALSIDILSGILELEIGL